ncbi:MAG: TerC/Alx family metal homeostasis membrane protein [Acidobacteriia bacterium]|nr:TerC/Alx family metal homeostasis membrane protein [Terriglobia bacterium]
MSLLGGHGLAAWVLFNLLILGLLALDLGVLHRKSHVVGFRESLLWNVVWTAVGLAFGWLVVRVYGHQPGLEYFTGYVIERALSFDNIFVFVVVFQYFRVAAEHQHRVLYWGILGALLMRGTLIVAGAALVAMFHWVLYLFGAFLLWSGVQLLVKKDEAPHPERNPMIRLVQRLLPVDAAERGPRFLVRRGGRWHATPLLIVLAVVETTDLVFALDSIPAIFAVTRDPFIIYTSNVMAILGLRAMYFLLAAMMTQFRFLRHGLSLVLVLVGLRMLVDRWVDVPTGLTLSIVCGILAAAVAASVLFRPRAGGVAGD